MRVVRYNNRYLNMMKKFAFLCFPACLLAFSSCLMQQPVVGQGQPQGSTTTTPSTNAQPGMDLGNLGGVLGNIISGITGSYTTTQASLVGTWSYYEPAVQFESENLLVKAGGAAAAAKVEQKLVPYYQKVGITPGRLVFTFDNAGNMSYSIGGGQAVPATYVFDNTAKTVTITTRMGLSLMAYVTISGNQMSLCFDSSKLLSLMAVLGSNGGGSGIGSVASSFEGMKTGFKFNRK